MKDNTFTGEVQSAIDAGMLLGEPKSPASRGAYAVLPKDCTIRSLEEFAASPSRVRQSVELFDADSFIAYILEFAYITRTRVFFDAESESFTAILDYHESTEDGTGEPGWCQHRAVFRCRRTPEFAAWMAKNKSAMSQIDFARFVEENLPDIVEPPGAQLLEVARTLEAKKEVTFSSGVRLDNGQVQFTYEEILRGSAARNTLEIPEQFVLGIAIHEGGPAYRIPVRLRYRIHEQKLVFWYEIVRPHRFLQDALGEIRQRVTSETTYPILSGAAK